jgi:hypothetical protein
VGYLRRDHHKGKVRQRSSRDSHLQQLVVPKVEEEVIMMGWIWPKFWSDQGLESRYLKIVISSIKFFDEGEEKITPCT